jgi:uncharacterized membrane protein YebE (DUF533 family)
MTNAAITAQDLLNQILSAGRDMVAEGKLKSTEIAEKARSGELTKKGKEIAAKGEDILVEKLGIQNTEAGRDALRKGVGTGAAAGALALLLSSRSGRKMATLGGLAGLGVLAYKAYEKNGGEIPNWKEDVIGLISGPDAETRSDTLLLAMVAAAKADGKISDSEMAILKGHNADALDVLEQTLAQEPDAKSIAARVTSPQGAREVYAVSCRVANGLSPQERDYLDSLAMALDLDPELAARLETDIRTG